MRVYQPFSLSTLRVMASSRVHDPTRPSIRAARAWVRDWQATHGPPEYRAPNVSHSPGRRQQSISRVVLQMGATSSQALLKHEKWMRTWWTLNPEYHYMLLSDRDCDAFVGAHASDDEQAAYGLLRTGAQRADLFRILFLRAIGGIYADLDLELRTPLRNVLPPEASSVVGSTWNFAFLAYQPRHPLMQYVASGVTRRVLEQHRAMRLGLPSKCYSPVSCVLKVTGPHSYNDLIAQAGHHYNCTNKWLPSPHHCRRSPNAAMRRMHVCSRDGGDGAWLCDAFTHWTCKRMRSKRSCDGSHYTRQVRNATAFFLPTPRVLPKPRLRSTSRGPTDEGTAGYSRRLDNE